MKGLAVSYMEREKLGNPHAEVGDLFVDRLLL